MSTNDPNYVNPMYLHGAQVGRTTRATTPANPNNQPDYRNYLDQGVFWPSASRDGDVLIDAMPPQHAISAFHRLTAGCDDRSMPANRVIFDSLLARSLLDQAVGESVTFTADVQESEDVPSAVIFTLEECFDMLTALDDVAHLHPIARAQCLQDLLNEQR